MPISVGWDLHDSLGTWGDLLPVFGGELGISLGFARVYRSMVLSGCASVWMCICVDASQRLVIRALPPGGGISLTCIFSNV